MLSTKLFSNFYRPVSSTIKSIFDTRFEKIMSENVAWRHHPVYSPIIGWSEAKFEDGITACVTAPGVHETESEITSITLLKDGNSKSYQINEGWPKNWSFQEIDNEGKSKHKLKS